MFEHRVQDDQQFAHARRQRDFFGFPGRTQALIECPNDGIEARGHDRPHIEEEKKGSAGETLGSATVRAVKCQIANFQIPGENSSHTVGVGTTIAMESRLSYAWAQTGSIP